MQNSFRVGGVEVSRVRGGYKGSLSCWVDETETGLRPSTDDHKNPINPKNTMNTITENKRQRRVL